MQRRKVLMFLAILMICVGCDQTTKQIAEVTLGGSVVSLVGDAVRFELAHNRGALLSMGAGLPSALRSFIFLWLVPLALAFVCVAAFAWDRVRGRRCSPSR